MQTQIFFNTAIRQPILCNNFDQDSYCNYEFYSHKFVTNVLNDVCDKNG